MNAKSLRSYLLAGFIVWIPILVTFVTVRFIIDLLDKTIALLPYEYQPEQLIGMHLPGLGVLLSLLLLLLTGVMATNFFGQYVVRWSELLLNKIPLVGSIYRGTKQVMETLFSTNSQAFRQVLLVQYPREGLWSMGFQTGVASVLMTGDPQTDMLSVFIPTTPNPTSGFLIMVPKKDAVELSMSIDEALKCIISLGVMQPDSSHFAPNTEKG